MKIYLMLSAWVVVLFLLGSIVSFLVMCCCDPRQKGHGLDQAYKSESRRQDNNSANDYEIKADGENDYPTLQKAH